MTIQSPLWTPGKGGLLKTTLMHDNGAQAEVYQYGAHLTSWISASGKPWVFTSNCAQFSQGTSIRGGVPVIFPQFNEFGSGPRHGFARNLLWSPHQHSGNEVILKLENNSQTQAWPHAFEAFMSYKLEDHSLHMTLNVINTSKNAFEFTCALHTYFQINGLDNTSISGIKGNNYWDNNGEDFDQRARFEQETLAFSDAIDRVYFKCQDPLELTTGEDRLKIDKSGFEDVVVWNPGQSAAAAMSDLGDDEYQAMLCIEAAQIDNPISLSPGNQWLGSQILTEETD